MAVRVARWIERSRVNGPGERFVLWVQGCPIHCAGCWNQQMWDPEGGRSMEAEQLADLVLSVPNIEGISLTGGEPFVQAAGLVPFVRRVRWAGLSVVAFSGFPLTALQHPEAPGLRGPRPDPASPALLELVDLLVAGPYDQNHPSDSPLVGSSNQRVHFLTDRYGWQDLETLPQVEVHLDGAVMTITGFPDELDDWLRS